MDAIPSGTWVGSEQERPLVLEVVDGRHCRWNDLDLEYQIQSGSVWFLRPDRTGSRWTIAVDGDVLTLRDREDFRYFGEGRYLYFDVELDEEPVTLTRTEEPPAPRPLP